MHIGLEEVTDLSHEQEAGEVYVMNCQERVCEKLQL